MDRRLHTLAVCRPLSGLNKDHIYTLNSVLYRISLCRKDTQWYSSDTQCIYPQVLIIQHLFHESGSPEQGSFWRMPDQHSADTWAAWFVCLQMDQRHKHSFCFFLHARHTVYMRRDRHDSLYNFQVPSTIVLSMRCTFFLYV